MELNEVRNFFQQMFHFSIPFAFEKIYITKICYEQRTFSFDHLRVLLTYAIFLREILQIESIVLLYFEGT